MAIRDAFMFIRQAGCDETLRARIALAGPPTDLAEIVAIAETLGLAFTEDELRLAFARDWNMRRLRYDLSAVGGDASAKTEAPTTNLR